MKVYRSLSVSVNWGRAEAHESPFVHVRAGTPTVPSFQKLKECTIRKQPCMNGFIHISLTKSYHMLEYSFLKGVVDRVY